MTMNKREQRLLGLVIAALIFAAGDYAWKTLMRDEMDMGETLVSQARTSVDQMTGQLATLPLTNNDRDELEAAQKSLTHDPLVRPPKLRANLRIDSLPVIVCDGFIRVGDTRLVILGGQEFGLGDLVPHTGEVVKTIGDDVVELEIPGTDVRRRLTYTEPALP